MTDDPPPPGVTSDELIDALVERALEPQRALLSPDEVEEHRRFLRSLAVTHPAFSSWLEAQRAASDAPPEPPPRDTPDRSGIVARQDRQALEAAARRTANKGRRR